MQIVIADNEPRVRAALRLLLKQEPDLYVVGEAPDAERLFAQVRALQPDLVLLDWELPGLATARAAAEVGAGPLHALRALCPHIAIIALSGWPHARQVALVAGADGCVTKSDSPERLLAAIHAISSRKAGKR